MKRRLLLRHLLPALFLGKSVILHAEVFLTTDKVKAIFFPDEKLTEKTITLTADQRKAIQKASGVRVREDKVTAWKSASGGWLIIDNVVGKHEFIDFALALKADGSVKGVEILTYRETYGGDVRNPKWRAQFSGKTVDAPLKIDSDIKNISGATLSSVHMTEGVKRLLHTYTIALKPLAS